MPKLRDKRAIIDRRQLAGRIAALAESRVASGPPARAPLLAVLKDALSAGRAEILRRFKAGEPGLTVAAANAFLIDQLCTEIYAYASGVAYPEANPTAGDRLCLVAVGGYGRREMAPYSDVDLLFLHPYKSTPRGEQIVEFMLYLLWDLSLTVGHAVRSVDECIARAAKDLTIRTNLLEARYMTGEQPLFTELHQRYGRELVAGKEAEFLVAKLAERDERHGRMGDSRYVLEPNIKDGKGGLRDLHTLFWIAKYLYGVSDHGELVGRGILTEGELKTFSRAYRFLWTLRCHLHYLAGRAEERLTFDVQPPIAEVMHYTDHAGTRGVERFMKHYYLVAKDVGDLTRIFCAAMEAEHQRKPRRWLPRLGLAKREVDGFLVDNGRVTVIADDAFEADPVRMITLFRVAQKHGFDIHPHALRLITRNLDRIDARLRADREANAAFMAMLTAESDPETTLRRMNEAGVLGRFIPDFGRVVAQTQHDMYHVYTVDEHSVFAIGVLTGIEQGGLGEELPLATEIIHEVLSRKALYLAVFLHDIAKGRGGNHSEIGARIAAKLGPRLGLRREETETVCWLVLNHLLFSNTAFKRDISDPQTVTDFVAKVQSPERLRLLLVVTVADIRAVGPNVWNGWKGQLLRDLYHEAAAVMIGGAGADERDARRVAAQARLRELLTGWSDSDVAAFLARGYPAYWLSFDPETLARHAHMMRDAAHDGRELAIESRIDRFRAVTEITVYCPDHHGLFAGVAGAIAVCGAGIAEARIFTTTDGMAIDTFWVQTADGRAFEDTIRLDRLEATIARTLSGDFKPAAALAQRAVAGGRTAVFKVVPRVLIDNRASATHTVVEINARDRVGLLHDIARTLVSLRLSIGSARIATFGERAVDVFYVKDLYGMKVIQPARIDDIRETLVAAVAEAPENAPGERAVAPAAE